MISSMLVSPAKPKDLQKALPCALEYPQLLTHAVCLIKVSWMETRHNVLILPKTRIYIFIKGCIHKDWPGENWIQTGCWLFLPCSADSEEAPWVSLTAHIQRKNYREMASTSLTKSKAVSLMLGDQYQLAFSFPFLETKVTWMQQ